MAQVNRVRPHFYILPFLADAVGIAYLGYREPFEVQRNLDLVMLIRATDKFDKVEGRWFAEPREVAKELQWFYNQSLIDVGKYSRLAKEDDLRYDRDLFLNGDNHDGFMFGVDGLGRFMLVHTDGSWLLFMQKSSMRGIFDSKVTAINGQALAVAMPIA